MKDEMVVLWYSNGDRWYASQTMTRQQAESLAFDFHAEGYSTRIISRHKATRKDICDEEYQLAY
jgi:hypothetical protein